MDDGDILLILNPTAGGVRRGIVDVIVRLLAGEGLRPTVHLTRGPKDAKAAAERGVAEGFKRIAVAGGDGTVGEVVAGIAGTKTAMGLIPLGTGNALGRELHLPLHDLPLACHIVAQGRTRKMDIGVCNDTPFAIMCGVGFDAEVGLGAEQGGWKKRLGRWAFVGQFVQELYTQRPHDFRVTVDGETIEARLWCVVVCNGSQYSWRLRFAREGRIDDGRLRVVLFEQEGRTQLLSEIAQHWWSRGTSEVPGARCLVGSSVRVEADPPARWQADGDVRGLSPVDIGVRPKALRLIVQE
jgi:diacylglycerol kinase (ATP)